jgi:hypothetical protein
MPIKKSLVGVVLLGLLGLGMGVSVRGAAPRPATGKVAGQPRQPAAASVLNKPDLVVEKIEFTHLPAGGSGHNVTVLYTIANHSQVPSRDRPTAAGLSHWQSNPSSNWLFEVSLEARDLPNGSFQRIAGNQTELGANGKQTIGTVEIVPAGKRREYRVKVDCYNWIDESNESNNEKTAAWPLKPFPESR